MVVAHFKGVSLIPRHRPCPLFPALGSQAGTNEWHLLDQTWLPNNQSTALPIGPHCLWALLLLALVQKQKGIEEA